MKRLGRPSEEKAEVDQGLDQVLEEGQDAQGQEIEKGIEKEKGSLNLQTYIFHDCLMVLLKLFKRQYTNSVEIDFKKCTCQETIYVAAYTFCYNFFFRRIYQYSAMLS